MEEIVLVYWMLTAAVVTGTRITYRMLSSETVLRTGDELIIFDTGLGDTGGLERELRRFSLDPRDFTYVFNTHIHVDHFGGNVIFENARKVMSRREYLFQKRWNEEFSSTENKQNFIRRHYPTLTDEEVCKITDTVSSVQAKYFKDRFFGSEDSFLFVEDNPPLPDCIEIIETPGHTPHHLSFRIRGVEQAAVIAGDLIPSKRSFFDGKFNFIEVYTDRGQAKRSLERLQLIIREQREVIIHPSHDRPFSVCEKRYVSANPYEIC